MNGKRMNSQTSKKEMKAQKNTKTAVGAETHLYYETSFEKSKRINDFSFRAISSQVHVVARNSRLGCPRIARATSSEELPCIL